MAEYVKLKDTINEAMMIELKPCPFGGNETNDCADCAYSGDFHFVKGECQRRDNNPELLKDGDKE